MKESPIIEVKDLKKHFGTVKAVDGISFEVQPGECFGLLGRNGAGKSTTIKMLIGLISPDSGIARINGYDLREDALGVRSSVGYVAQSLG